MAREWLLGELLAMFPDSSRGTRRVLRCLWRTSGEGRAIRDKGGIRVSVTVSLTASPASQFAFRLSASWPKGLEPSEKQAFESELLHGIIQGTVECEDPPWLCRLECTRFAADPAEGAVSLIRVAAIGAVRALVEGGGWDATGGPGDHVA